MARAILSQTSATSRTGFVYGLVSFLEKVVFGLQSYFQCLSGTETLLIKSPLASILYLPAESCMFWQLAFQKTSHSVHMCSYRSESEF
jgi:hypothetical protein